MIRSDFCTCLLRRLYFAVLKTINSYALLLYHLNVFVSVEMKRKEKTSFASLSSAVVLQSVALKMKVSDLLVVIFARKYRMVGSNLGNIW